MDINNYILQEALKKGICDDWAKKLPDASLDQLFQMYVEGIDFCLSNNFPSNDFLKEYASHRLAFYGIWVDEVVRLTNPEKLILLGSCSAKALIRGYSVSQIFIKHDSKAEIDVADNSFVVIDIFDNSTLIIDAFHNCKVLVNVYGNAKVEPSKHDRAHIKIVKKHKEGY